MKSVKVSGTRMELLSCRQKIELARQGRELLEKKRMVLLEEFLKIVDTVIERSDFLQEVAKKAVLSLARAEAIAGVEELKSAAMIARSEFILKVSMAKLMGVNVPVIEQRSVSRSFFERGYSIVGTSLTIDETADAFEEQVDAIIQLAEYELRLKRLAQEIQTTSRRLNALDNLLIPELEAELKTIRFKLEERERADHYRMRHIKQTLLKENRSY